VTINNESKVEFNVSPKYPCRRMEYCKEVGREGQEMIKTALQDIINPIFPSAIVFSNPEDCNGPDITIYDDKTLFLGEVLNFGKNSYIKTERAKKIRKNLRGVKHKAIFTTFERSINKLHKVRMILRHIPKFYTGFQVLPPDFYTYYQEKAQVEKNPNLILFRELHGKSTLEWLRERLEVFLVKTRILLPMYMSVGKKLFVKTQGRSQVGEVAGVDYYSSSVNAPFVVKSHSLRIWVSTSRIWIMTLTAYGLHPNRIRKVISSMWIMTSTVYSGRIRCLQNT